MIIETLYYSDGYKAVVRCDCQCLTDIKPPDDIEGRFYSISKDGMITAKENYAYDFATGAMDTDTIKRASLFHDIVCQAIAEGKLDPMYQVNGDRLLRDLCLHDGMSRFRAWYVYRAVRAYQKNKKRTIFDAHPIQSVPRFNA